MKQYWMAAALAAALLAGGAAQAAQPGLAETAEAVSVTAGTLKFDSKLPQWEGGTALARAKVNGALAAERLRFAERLAKAGEKGDVEGWLSWQAGRTDDRVVSLLLLESIYFKGAAHPTTHVVGMTFDGEGDRVTVEDILPMTGLTSPEALNGLIEKQGAERGLMLFPAEWRQVSAWPEEFYVGTDGKIYFLFQQYEIAPYAAGWLAIEAGTYQER